jgi:hypothetical protein
LRLLDPDRNGDAREVIHELVILEKRNLPGGGVQIAAPAGKHDDMACVTALAAFKASWMMQTVSREKKDAEPSLFEKCMASVRRKKLERERGMWD